MFYKILLIILYVYTLYIHIIIAWPWTFIHTFIHIIFYKIIMDIPEKITHNVPAVGEVLGARTGKRKGNPFHKPLRFQGT